MPSENENLLFSAQQMNDMEDPKKKENLLFSAEAMKEMEVPAQNEKPKTAGEMRYDRLGKNIQERLSSVNKFIGGFEVKLGRLWKKTATGILSAPEIGNKIVDKAVDAAVWLDQEGIDKGFKAVGKGAEAVGKGFNYLVDKAVEGAVWLDEEGIDKGFRAVGSLFEGGAKLTMDGVRGAKEGIGNLFNSIKGFAENKWKKAQSRRYESRFNSHVRKGELAMAKLIGLHGENSPQVISLKKKQEQLAAFNGKSVYSLVNMKV